MAASLGCVMSVGVLAYVTSILLPLFYANCPYKTPFSFMLLSWVRRRVDCLKSCRWPQSSAIPYSLKEMESADISENAEELEALAVSWLHNTSSNLSVQSVALQSLGSLPLHTIGIVTGPVGIVAPVSYSEYDTCRTLDVAHLEEEGRPAVIRAIRVHHRFDQPVDRMERFQRAALRFGKYVMLSRELNRFDFVYNHNPARAINVIRSSLLGEPSVTAMTYDVVFWGKVFEAALRPGLGFLKIESTHGDGPLSAVWYQLLICAIQEHDCYFCDCEGNDHPLFSYCLGPDNFPLVINRYDVEKNGTSATLSEALKTNMRPSFVGWVLQVGFAHVERSASTYTQHLPDDILLVLAMLQTRSVQVTSSAHATSSDDCLFKNVLQAVSKYALHLGDSEHHKDADRAAIFALRAVIESDAFGTGNILTLADEGFIVEILFSGLNRRLEFSGLSDRDSSWLTANLFQKVWRLTTASLESRAVEDGWAVVAHVFTYVSHFATQLVAVETIYAYLVKENWLQNIGADLSRLSKPTAQSGAYELPDLWCPGYMFTAAMYIDGFFLHNNASLSSEVFRAAGSYIVEPAHLSTLGKILLLADMNTQNKLWRLVKMSRNDACNWSQFTDELCELVACQGVENEYDRVRSCVHRDVHGNKAVYFRPLNELPSLIDALATDISRGHFTPPTPVKSESKVIDPELHDRPGKQGFLNQWRRSWLGKGRQRESLEMIADKNSCLP
ncbi:hypothetical protein BDZ89DRAFT_1134945 [Hymenopellis radicata]|nr:hypothetical protein BDZ89DRAFT_1134945 [Hymenopellis radicata]